jgi:diguanylate cyclase (GGDEF)-like protein/PAS domain S-box-containing protein
MSIFEQLTSEQRCQIEALNKSGFSQQAIEDTVGVSQPTISRELQRNTGESGYCHLQVQRKTEKDSMNSLHPLRLWLRGLSPFDLAGAALIVFALPVMMLLSVPEGGEFLSQQHALWVHSLLEMLSIAAAACIFVAGWQLLDTQRSYSAVLLVCAALSAAVLNAGHLLSNNEMLYSFTARFIVASALLLFVLAPQEPRSTTLRRRFWFLGITAVLLILIILAFEFRAASIPLSYSAESGGNAAYLLAHALTISLHVMSLLVIRNRAESIQVNNRTALAIAVSLLALGELFSLNHGSLLHSSNIVVQLCTMAAYIFLYRALFLDGAVVPLVRLRRRYNAMGLFARHREREDLFENAPDGILTVDETGVILRLNAQVESMFGYSRYELRGQPLEKLLPLALLHRHYDLRSAYLRTPTGRPVPATCGLVGRRKDGSEISLDISLGKYNGLTGIETTVFIRDVSERREVDLAIIEHRATHDTLTGLPNRALLQDRLDRSLIHARRQKSACAVMMLDLDNFKDINNGWGHGVGDELLVAVSRRISAALRQGDTVARFGGDEFVILVAELGSNDAVAAIAEKIVQALQSDFKIGTHHFHVTASIGVAIYPQHACDAETLMSHAEIAMYSAKSVGRNAVCYFDEGIGMVKQETLRLKVLLAEALDMQAFELHYQPQYGVMSGEICGFEALLRWRTQDGRWISPENFIPVAETSGLIIPITEWVLLQACRQIRVWALMGFNYRVSVNISALHFRREGSLLALVRQVLAKTGVDPQHLGLELTETALMDKPEVAAGILTELVALGLHVSIDDFGTGYSSLASLQMYPLHTLKIDRSFMCDVASNTKSAAIVCGLVSLARSLGLQVLAEGVETAEQLAVLRQYQCDAIQGWLMQPALPPAECEKLLRAAA